jgi:hypothetical protein
LNILGIYFLYTLNIKSYSRYRESIFHLYSKSKAGGGNPNPVSGKEIIKLTGSEFIKVEIMVFLRSRNQNTC